MGRRLVSLLLSAALLIFSACSAAAPARPDTAADTALANRFAGGAVNGGWGWVWALQDGELYGIPEKALDTAAGWPEAPAATGVRAFCPAAEGVYLARDDGLWRLDPETETTQQLSARACTDAAARDGAVDLASGGDRYALEAGQAQLLARGLNPLDLWPTAEGLYFRTAEGRVYHADGGKPAALERLWASRILVLNDTLYAVEDAAGAAEQDLFRCGPEGPVPLTGGAYLNPAAAAIWQGYLLYCDGDGTWAWDPETGTARLLTEAVFPYLVVLGNRVLAGGEVIPLDRWF